MPTLEKQSVLDQVILGIAHELNNPNAFVRMNLVNLKKMFWLLRPCLDEYEKNHPDEKLGPFTLDDIRTKFNQHIESTLDATVRIISIADKLKQCSSDILDRMSEFSLAETLHQVIMDHKFLLDRTTQTSTDFDPTSHFPISGHRLQLEQAISILLTNACDAIRDTHGEQGLENGRLSISLQKKATAYLLTVTDNGCGMNQITLDKIFDPYFTTKPQGVGEGLGMPICRTIVHRHEGTISVESEEGKGTTITIQLPLSKGTDHGQE